MYAAISANGIAMTFVARRSCRALRRSARMMISAIRHSCPSCFLKQPPPTMWASQIVPQLKLVLVFQNEQATFSEGPQPQKKWPQAEGKTQVEEGTNDPRGAMIL